MPDIAWGSYTMLATGSLIGLFAAYRILLQGFSLLFWVLLLMVVRLPSDRVLRHWAKQFPE